MIDEIAHAAGPRPADLRGAAARAAGVAAASLRQRVQPRQHRARRRRIARDATPRAALGHRRALRARRRGVARPAWPEGGSDAGRAERGRPTDAGASFRAARARQLRGLLRHPTPQAHADRAAGRRADAGLLAVPERPPEKQEGISFQMSHAERASVWIINSDGNTVATLVREADGAYSRSRCAGTAAAGRAPLRAPHARRYADPGALTRRARDVGRIPRQ